MFLLYDTAQRVKLQFYASLNREDLWTWKYTYLASFSNENVRQQLFLAYHTLPRSNLAMNGNSRNKTIWKKIPDKSFQLGFYLCRNFMKNVEVNKINEL